VRRVAGILAVGLAAFTVTTCDSGPTAGELIISLTSSNADDGAIQFTAKATAPDSIIGATALCTGCQVFTAKVSATELRGVVTGNITAGPLVRIGVTDVNKPELYSASFVAAASKTFKVQTGTYSLAVQK
jgi:hypothetical protein